MADMMDPDVNFDYNVDQEATANQEAQRQQQAAQDDSNNNSASGRSSDSGSSKKSSGKSNDSKSSGKSNDSKSSGDPQLDALNAKIKTIQQALNESSGYKRDELAQQLAIATADRNARQKVAETSADASKYGADQQLKGTEYSSDNSLAGTKYASDNSLAGTKYSSDNSLTGTKYASDNSLAGTIYGANAGLEGTKYASDNSLKGTQYASDNSLAGTKYSADQGLAGTKYSSDNSLKGTEYASNNSLYGSMYGANQQLAGTQYSSDAGERNSQRSLEGSMYSADQGLTGTKYSADSSRAASEYGSNLGLEGSMYSADTSGANTRYTTDADLYKFNASQPLERAKLAQTFLQNYEAMASHPDSFLQASQFGRLGAQTEGMPAMLNDLLGQVNPYASSGGNIAFSTHNGALPQTAAQATFGDNPLGLVNQRAATPDMPVYHQAQLQTVGRGQDPTQLYQTVNPTVGQVGVGTAGASAGQQPIVMPSWLTVPNMAPPTNYPSTGEVTPGTVAHYNEQGGDTNGNFIGFNGSPSAHGTDGAMNFQAQQSPYASQGSAPSYSSTDLNASNFNFSQVAAQKAAQGDQQGYWTYGANGQSSFTPTSGGGMADQYASPQYPQYNQNSASDGPISQQYLQPASSNISSAYGTSAGTAGSGSANYSMPNAISSLGSQPRALTGQVAGNDAQNAQFLSGVQQAVAKGPQQWGNQALEKMTQTERDMFSSGLKASGLVPDDVYAAYNRSRIGNDASMAGKAA